MKQKNVELLDEVIETKLEEALHTDDLGLQNAKIDEALEAVDRRIKIKELEDSKELKKEESKKNRLFEWLKIGVPVATLILSYCMEKRHMERLCNFETDGTLTTTAGRQVSSRLFRKK